MAWKLMYLEALDAPHKAEAAREAERRAMYARPDALPLPEEPPRKSWLAAILGRNSAPETARPTQVRKAARSE
jgi:hypothetical protein